MNPGLVIAVLAGGAVGAVARFGVSTLAARRPGFPWAVLVVNVVGSTLAGVIAGLVESGGVSRDAQLVVVTGFCGGLTTFSTFATETVQLAMDRRWRTLVLSVGANLVLGVGAASVAYALTR